MVAKAEQAVTISLTKKARFRFSLFIILRRVFFNLVTCHIRNNKKRDSEALRYRIQNVTFKPRVDDTNQSYFSTLP